MGSDSSLTPFASSFCCYVIGVRLESDPNAANDANDVV